MLIALQQIMRNNRLAVGWSDKGAGLGKISLFLLIVLWEIGFRILKLTVARSLFFGAGDEIVMFVELKVMSYGFH